jgi:hypothetical protein
VSARRTNLVLAAGVTVLALLAGEIALRLIDGVALTDLANFRVRNRPVQAAIDFADYDPLLGWIARARYDGDNIYTVDLGIRRNSAAQSAPRRGETLAVGDSVTLGTRLVDEQSWPARLESLTGQPINNAGVPGFGLDQVVLRAESLLSVLHARTLLVGIGSDVIARSGQSKSWGVPKPFFTIENGALRAHNDPVPRWQLDASNPLADAFGHLHVADRVMSWLDPDDWLLYASSTRGASEPVAVSCLLLARLKATLDAEGVRAILVLQPVWSEITPGVDPAGALAKVTACGRQLGYGVVDTTAAFATDYAADRERTRAYYRRDGFRLTDAGNRYVAGLVAPLLDSASMLSPFAVEQTR